MTQSKPKRVRKYPFAKETFRLTDVKYLPNVGEYRCEVHKIRRDKDDDDFDLMYTVHGRGRKECAFRAEFLKNASESAIKEKYIPEPESLFIRHGKPGDQLITHKKDNHIHALAKYLGRKVALNKFNIEYLSASGKEHSIKTGQLITIIQ